MPSFLAAAAFCAGIAFAQSSTAGSPTVSLFLPIANPGDLAASVITAAPSATVYAIGCATQSSVSDACVPGCSLDSSITITEGVSTLEYTWTDADAQVASTGFTSLIADLTTVNCNLIGGTRASQAICTGSSAIPGLGNGTQTTTLASSQINYVAVTVTAGATKLASIAAQATGTNTASGSSSTGAGGAGASSSRAAGAAMATVARYAVGAVAGIAAVGLL